jgi:hypothetical protein
VSRTSRISALALVAVLVGACSDGSSEPPATTPAPPTTIASTAATSPVTVATTTIPFPGGINGPVAPGPTEPATR